MSSCSIGATLAGGAADGAARFTVVTAVGFGSGALSLGGGAGPAEGRGALVAAGRGGDEGIGRSSGAGGAIVAAVFGWCDRVASSTPLSTRRSPATAKIAVERR
jgi:hypothetical protein